MKRIRVLHLLTSLAAGGAETNLLALLRKFNRYRFEHAVAFGGGGTLEAEFAQEDIQLIPLSTGPLNLRSAFDIPAMLVKIKDFAPDIIHAHLHLPNALGLIAKRALGCKLVLHLHGVEIIPRKKLPGRGIKHWMWGIIAHLYHYCDRAIAICAFQLPYLERLGMRGDQVVLVPNGITLEGYPIQKGEIRNGFQFINVARFAPAKDHDLLVRAFRDVSQQMPHVHLILVGDGPLRARVEHLVQALRLQEKVTFLGTRRDVPVILTSSHCFILNSRWELSPITILEAMRAGLPVIASDVGGVADMVAHEVTGLLVEPGDQAGLTRAMLVLASDPQRSKNMGRSGYNLVAERFSNELTAKKIESIYDGVLNHGEPNENS